MGRDVNLGSPREPDTLLERIMETGEVAAKEIAESKIFTTMAVKALAASTDYAAEDILTDAAGGAFIFNLPEPGEIIKAIAFCSVTALTPQITLYLFNEQPAGTFTDNAANTNPTIGNSLICDGWIDFLALEDLGGVSASLVTVGTYGNLGMVISAPNKRLWGIPVTRQAITGETANMILGFKLWVRKD